MIEDGLDRVDARVAGWLARHGLTLLRISLGIVFLWFGALKFLPGVSPAQELATRFATPALDRFAGLRWTFSPLGTPWIEPSMTAAADCVVCRSLEVGDHTLLFGVIRNVRVRGGQPLLYGLHRYHGWQG